MLAEESYIKSITTYLSIFSDYIETLSSINLHDASVVAENFCAKLMNLAFSLELDNANHLMKNAEVIDLYDTLNKVSVQVTSNKKLDKVKGCLNAFIEKELYEEYKTLYIYILTSKQKSYKVDPVSLSDFSFDAKIHVLDKKDLIFKIQGKSLILQKEILELCKDNIPLPKEDNIIANEVSTILNLVSILSESSKKSNFDKSTVIDPDKKIPLRFKEKAKIINNQYFMLCCHYQPILEEVILHDNYDSVTSSSVAMYLQDKSSELLMLNNFDAQSALDKLIYHVEELFKKQKLSYNTTAIKYYVLKHLTECNVFPLLLDEVA